jgi:peptidoglycan/LPS O-acetylase OafA/YrhL
LVYLNNWQMISGGSDYFAVTAAPSPLEHTWSLAIEEQFYLLCPLLLMVVLRWRHPRRRLLLLCLGGVTASAVEHVAAPGRAVTGR